MADRVKFVDLPDGRRLAYQEFGCTNGTSKIAVLALHGLMSCRLAGMPGVSEETLREFGVRLIAIDRPGYGRSDPHPSQTFHSTCIDIEEVIDVLNLGKKIWLHGYSMGGAFCWAAARYIPDRIEGITMWCPVGNFWWKGISNEERKAMQSIYSTTDRILMCLCRYSPFILIKWYSRLLTGLVVNPSWDFTANFSPPDKKCVELQPGLAEKLYSEMVESVTRNKGFGVGKDYELMIKGWDFELREVEEVFKGEIHIWQGDADTLVPLGIQKWAQKQIPNGVHLHELTGEGHISLVASTDVPRLTLSTLSRTHQGDLHPS